MSFDTDHPERPNNEANPKASALSEAIYGLTNLVDDLIESIQNDPDAEHFDGAIEVSGNILDVEGQEVSELMPIVEFLGDCVYEAVGRVAKATRGYPQALTNPHENISKEDYAQLVQDERNWVYQLHRKNKSLSAEDLTRLFYRELGKRVASNYIIPGTTLLDQTPADEHLGKSFEGASTVRTGYSPFTNTLGVSMSDLRSIETDDELAKIQEYLVDRFQKYIMRCNYSLEVIIDEDGYGYVKVGEQIYSFAEQPEQISYMDLEIRRIASLKGSSRLSVLTQIGVNDSVMAEVDGEGGEYGETDGTPDGLFVGSGQGSEGDMELEQFSRYFNEGKVGNEEMSEVLEYLIRSVDQSPQLMSDSMELVNQLLTQIAFSSGQIISVSPEQKFFNAVRFGMPAPTIMQILSKELRKRIGSPEVPKTKLGLITEPVLDINNAITSIAHIYPLSEGKPMPDQAPLQKIFDRLSIIEPLFLQEVLTGLYTGKYNSITEGMTRAIEYAKGLSNQEAIRKLTGILKEYNSAKATLLRDPEGGIHFKYLIDRLSAQIEGILVNSAKRTKK
jgi:hypothetical protein